MIDNLVARGITVRFNTNSMKFENSPQSRLILTMMEAVAEFEQGMIASRTSYGIALAKKAGKNTPDEIAKLCDCGRATVFRVKKELIENISEIGR